MKRAVARNGPLGVVSVDVSPVTHLHHKHSQFDLRDRIHDSILSLSDSVLVLAGKLFAARWPGLGGKGLDAPNDPEPIVLGGSFDLSGRRGFNQNPITCHVSSDP